MYAVGEYWSGDLNELNTYLNDSGHCMHLFDVPLHFNLLMHQVRMMPMICLEY